jgi:hypothetical protein
VEENLSDLGSDMSKLMKMAFPYFSNLLSTEGEEKVDERSNVGMSRYANAFTLTPLVKRLTRTSLRSFTLSIASDKEGWEE